MATATVRAQQPTSPVAAFIKSNVQLVVAFIVLVIIYAYFMLAAPSFTQTKIFTDILLRATYIGIVALGATFIITTAGIDLSIGTSTTLVAVMADIFSSADWINLPLGVGLILVLLFGAFVDLINDVDISILGLPSFITAFTMIMIARGLALIISDRSTVSIANKDYVTLSTDSLFPTVGGATLTNAALIFVLLTILAAFLLSKILLGCYAPAIGSNEEATYLSGVNIRLWKVIVYVVAGVFMAISTIFYSARSGFVQPAEGVNSELNVIAAIVIGDTSLFGGHASIPDTLLDTLIMGTLKKSLTMMGVASEWKLVIIGVVVLLAVFIGNIRRARENTA